MNLLSNLTTIQKLAITMAVLGVLSTSGVQLTEIMGAVAAKSVVSSCSLFNSILAAVVAVLSGQGPLVKQVLAMPGVEKIDVNAKANATLAQIAVDPSVDKIAPVPEAVNKVTEIATKG